MENSGINSKMELVGKIVQGRVLKAPVLANILAAAWKTRAPFQVDEWGSNVFHFRFEDAEDRRNVVQEGPWSVMNNLMVLLPLADGMVIPELQFNTCPFWVQIHGLPVEKMSRANAESIGKRFGKLLALEMSPNNMLLARSFLRVRVEIDINNPLPKGFWMKGKEGFNKDRWISFKYENLPDYCYACGRVGHDQRSCKNSSREEGEKSGYGPDLRTGRAKKGTIPIEEIKREVVEEEDRTHNLIKRRPVNQAGSSCARADNSTSERVNQLGLVQGLQMGEGMRETRSTISTDGRGSNTTSVSLSMVTGITQSITPLSNTQEISSLVQSVTTLPLGAYGLGQPNFNSPPQIKIKPPSILGPCKINSKSVSPDMEPGS
ncbi:hypothetical protein Vadar_029522 [Vaccinium darrowii]|uniref:Uncharacterized protein n=1 Tax=Vaccinium darrowii TaxID=229202 RepID=A0ACB7ZEM2_9ERIC|nr:hypothetical protein Vadar_029522 [Vaccinium darrowii]